MSGEPTLPADAPADATVLKPRSPNSAPHPNSTPHPNSAPRPNSTPHPTTGGADGAGCCC